MKYTFLLLVWLNISTSNAQDTLRKLVEYDIQIEALQQVEHPWVKKAIEVSGERYWLEVVFEKVAIGELPVYRSYLAPNIYARIQLSEINQNFEGTLEDVFWVIDPITFEERVQFKP